MHKLQIAAPLTCANGVRDQNLEHGVRSRSREASGVRPRPEHRAQKSAPIQSGATSAEDVDERYGEDDVASHLARRSDGGEPLKG